MAGGDTGREVPLVGHKLDTQCREIFVKAVCAKGRSTTEQVHTIKSPADVVDILGCRVTGLRFGARLRGDFVRISGEYVLQVWVAFDSDSELLRERVDFREDIALHEIGEGCLDADPEALVDVVSGPTVIECGINKDGRIEVVVALEFQVDIVGKTRLFVRTCEPEEASGTDVADLLDDDWNWLGDDPEGA